jgi:hypothetical protein
MSATAALSVRRASRPGHGADAIRRLLEGMQQLLRRDRLLSISSDTVGELPVARHGPVEINRSPAAWWLETCVKGEPDQARATALRRLGNYASRRRLRIARPLVQAEEAAGRWRLAVALPGISDEVVTAIARSGRVRLRALDAQTLAVIRVTGRPTRLAMQHAETAVRLALAPTRWAPAGSPVLRLHSLPTALPFLSRFEVAIPVVEQMQGADPSDWLRRLGFGAGPPRDAATPASPPTR